MQRPIHLISGRWLYLWIVLRAEHNVEKVGWRRAERFFKQYFEKKWSEMILLKTALKRASSSKRRDSWSLEWNWEAVGLPILCATRNIMTTVCRVNSWWIDYSTSLRDLNHCYIVMREWNLNLSCFPPRPFVPWFLNKIFQKDQGWTDTS